MLRNAFSYILILLFLASCNTKTPKQVKLEGMVQGSYYNISYFSSENNEQEIKKGIDSIFSAIDNSISLWEKNSIINKVNNNINTKLDSIFIENFILSQRFSRMTYGAFDISVGGLVEAYGFASKSKTKLNDRIIDSLLSYVDYKALEIRGDSLIKKILNQKIDFNAIAQGYTTDKVSEFLVSKGINSFIVDIGGEVRAKGTKPNGKKWTCAIETPNEDNSLEREFDYYLELEDEAIVTSGNYRKFYTENGKKYSHTINPKTGKSVTHSLLSASVLSKDATSADAIATAFMVMGMDSSLVWLKKYPEYEAHFIYSSEDGKLQTYTTPGLKKRLISNER